MKIKVAMIAELPLPGEPIDGGVQAVTSYLVTCLRNCPDVELYVITFRMDGEPGRSLNREGYVQYTIPFSSLGTITGFRKDQENLNRCLAAIQPDIVHSQGAGHHGILASRSGLPSVTTIHGIQS